MPLDKPKLTVGLPIYNGEKFLRECVVSVKNQSFKDFEVVVILDGCTDSSLIILSESMDERFVIHKNETNEGLAAVSNKILKFARAPLIARVDQDDVLYADRFEKQMSYMENHPEVDILSARFDCIDDRGQIVSKPFPFPETHEDIKNAFTRYNAIAHQAVIYRTERILAAGGYDPEFKIADDLALWLKCFSMGYRFANLPDVVTHYRSHPKQASKERLQEMLRFHESAYEKYGVLIWGDKAPDIRFGLPFHQRVLRRLKRIFAS